MQQPWKAQEGVRLPGWNMLKHNSSKEAVQPLNWGAWYYQEAVAGGRGQLVLGTTAKTKAGASYQQGRTLKFHIVSNTAPADTCDTANSVVDDPELDLAMPQSKY